MRISAENLRVYLSTPTFDDAEAIKGNMDDPDIALNSPGIPSPYGLENAAQFVELASQKYAAREGFHMCIKLLNANVIGICALDNIETLNGKAEIGYIVGKEHWGNGYAKEAISLIMGFGFAKLNLDRIYAKVPMHNERSIRLLTSMGFKKDGTVKEDIMGNGTITEEFVFSMSKNDNRNGIDVAVEGY